MPAFRDDSGDHGPFFHTECKAFITKKDMACELEVKDMTTRLGESFPMDLMAWNSFGMVKDNVTGIRVVRISSARTATVPLST